MCLGRVEEHIYSSKPSMDTAKKEKETGDESQFVL